VFLDEGLVVGFTKQDAEDLLVIENSMKDI